MPERVCHLRDADAVRHPHALPRAKLFCHLLRLVARHWFVAMPLLLYLPPADAKRRQGDTLKNAAGVNIRLTAVHAAIDTSPPMKTRAYAARHANDANTRALAINMTRRRRGNEKTCRVERDAACRTRHALEPASAPRHAARYASDETTSIIERMRALREAA